MVEKHLHDLFQVSISPAVHLLELGIGDSLVFDLLEEIISGGVLGYAEQLACQGVHHL